MKAIIFGVSGQDGFYLSECCARRGIEVLGVSRRPSHGSAIRGDVADAAFVGSLVGSASPDFIFHLAANSTTRHEALYENHATICTGSVNVLEAARLYRPACRVFIAGSGVQFVNTGAPIAETDPFAATSAYAVARIHAAYAARYYRGLGVRAYVGYLFHHESPLRRTEHVCKMIAEAARRIKGGSNERLQLRDIGVRKETAFAGDIVEGMLALVTQDLVFEATIGTGVGYTIEQWLEACFAAIGKDWREFVDLSADGGSGEYRTLVSNPATIRSLGWRPKVGFQALVEMMLA